ncbi:leucyl aminopeptidase [Candidatus Fukatsuia anoeciicola]|uniref:leucyl aminopeptidase n=1 Tax=Candidatus Fukatsuia anoeciicola TaxID=2994492 RepID=UPI003464BE69
MDFSIKKCNMEEKYDVCVIGVFETYHLSLSAKKLNKASNGYISNFLNYKELKGKVGQTLLLYNLLQQDIPRVSFKRILLINCGKKSEFNKNQYKKVIQKTIQILNGMNITEALYCLTELPVKDCDIYQKVRQAVETIQEMLYTFTQFKSKKVELYHSLKKITFNITESFELNDSNRALVHALAVSLGIKKAKDLANMPPNICNATYLAKCAYELNEIHNTITTEVVDEKKMKELGMNAYLAVGQSSQNESLMSVIKYNGNPDQNVKPIVLIGKGLTFDSGGISLKPGESMDEMKYDMCGAATVYGVICALLKLQLRLNVIGILAGCENMLDGNAYRPGDILTTMSGQTVEILNTDAEGRMVLCDVLTYVERFNPELVIDIATLTGACVIALGHHITGLMSNNTPLADKLIIASEQSCDRVWRLPLNNDYCKQLNSKFADMANIGGRPAGAITAGCFLSYFATKYHWAHLDIAGTAWYSGENKGATGRPVALLIQFLLNQVNLNTGLICS